MSLATQTAAGRPAAARTLKLYEVPALYADLMDRLEESGGELSPDDEALLDSFHETLRDKADGIAALVQSFAATADAAKAEADRLYRLARSRANAADRLKAYLKGAMESLGESRVVTLRFTARIQANSVASVAFDGFLNELPDRFKRVTVEADLSAAREAHRAGEELPAGFTVTRGTHLRIQ